MNCEITIKDLTQIGRAVRIANLLQLKVIQLNDCIKIKCQNNSDYIDLKTAFKKFKVDMYSVKFIMP